MFYLIIVLNMLRLIECAMEPFIVGGKEANIKQFPYSAYIFMSCLSTKTYWSCGSSILNERVVLTAAHCLISCAERPRTITVFAGHKRKSRGQSSSVSNFYLHERYSADASVFDIALARLKTSLQFGELVQRIAILGHSLNDKVAEVAGWGLINERDEVSTKILQHTKQIIVKRPECQKRIRNIPHGTICGETIDGHSYASGLLGFISCEKMSHQTVRRKEGVPIVGGQIARIEDFPYSAFLKIKRDVGGNYAAYMCGASIVNDRIAMTAAHCIFDCGPRSKVSISVGKNSFGGHKAWVHKFLIHKSFTAHPLTNDIALIKLKTSLQFGKKVKRVALMPDPPYLEKARVAGWGRINEETSEKSPYLQYVDQYVRKTKECVKVIRNMPKGTLCASSRKETSYASRGDSGSALVVRGYIQIGIVSYKIPKISRSLVVYTDTGYFYDWITHNTKRLYCS